MSIEVDGLEKRFGRIPALSGVTFTVAPGEVVGFLGENGAGKTTTLRIVAGFLAPDRGRVRVDGIDVERSPREAQRRLGYLCEGAPLPDELRVGEYLAHRARLKGVPRARVDAALDAARAGAVAGRRTGQLSRGWRQRVALADALLADPPVLVLDEPTAHLDPVQLAEMRALVVALARERTVLLSTHQLAEVEAMAARILILAGGRIAAAGSVAELRGDPERCHVTVAPEAAPAAREALGGEILDAAAGRLAAPLSPAEAARRLVDAGIDVVELGPGRTLEDVFRTVSRP